MIYITVKTEYNKILQNKVAIRCDINKENIQEIAKKAFEDICTMDKIDQSEVCYNIFIKNKLDFYKLCATSDERQDKITNENVLFITVKTKLDTVLQNKVALHCDIENENIEEIAEDCFEGISLILGFPKEQLCYEIFIKNNGIFYTLKNAK